MAAEEERELDALLSELRATEDPPREQALERARRLRMSRAIERQAHAQGAPPEARKLRRRPLAAWALGGVAAALLVVSAVVFREPQAATVEAELIDITKRPHALATPPVTAASTEPAESSRSETVKEIRATRRPLAPPSPPQAPSAVAPATSGATLDAAAPDEATGGASLAAQNELFQAAVRAARRGDDEAAIREFDLLLERFPTSPLAADSLVRKFRTLARLGRAAESAAAAREYMARYPQGFAAAEAEKLLKTSPSDGASGGP